MMNNSKSFCIKCETIQRHSAKCLKCQSNMIFDVGVKARFPKYPKKDDYVYMFRILIGRMARSYTMDEIKSIHKYFNNHKYANSVASDGMSFKEVANEIFTSAKDKKLNHINEQNKRHIEDMHNFLSFNSDVVIDKLCDHGHRKQGYIVPALYIILGREDYDIYAQINMFKPVRVSVISDIVFEDKNTALSVASTVAQEFLAHQNSKKYPILERYAKTYAKKKDLVYRYPEYYI